MSHFDDRAPICVDFPLQGEWLAPNSPGNKIPSHGTNFFAQRYAYDFITARDMALAGTLAKKTRYWLGGIPVSEISSWNQPILSPVSGKIITARDGWPESKKASGMGVVRAFTNSLTMSEDSICQDMRKLAGNFLIIEAQDCFAFLAHATTGSIRVIEGQKVEAGQHIANVGHTGNSTLPHLHFHLMDSPDLFKANGLPCCFSSYEQLEDDQWQQIENGIPGGTYPIRSKRPIAAN